MTFQCGCQCNELGQHACWLEVVPQKTQLRILTCKDLVTHKKGNPQEVYIVLGNFSKKNCIDCGICTLVTQTISLCPSHCDSQ